ncbi:MAG: Hpt domain-containing protein [Acidobacteriaceae bacterium]
MREADDEPTLDRKMDALLAGIWAKSKPVMAKRVALLRAASEAIQSAGALPADEHEAAISAAHNLAGVLGTFGFQDGTDAARSIELILRGRQATLADAEVLAPMVATLEEVMQR